MPSALSLSGTLSSMLSTFALGVPQSLEEALVRRDAAADRLRPFLDQADLAAFEAGIVHPSRLSLASVPLAEEGPKSARFFLVSWPDPGEGMWVHEQGAYDEKAAAGLPLSWCDPHEWRLGRV